MPHPLDIAIQLKPIAGNRFQGATTPAYANMVGPFGGATGAALLNAVLVHPQRLGEPLSLTVNFAGPLADGPFEIEAIPVRTNRSTQHWSLQLVQGGQVATTASAVTVVRRSTWSDQEVEAPQGMPAAGDLTRASLQGAPAWTQCYDMRFAPGEDLLAFDGKAQAHSNSRFWVRDEPARPLDFPALAAISDCFFPRLFVRRHAPALVGTVSLTTYFHADGAMLAAHTDRHLLACARAVNYRNGYFDQSAEVWSDTGELMVSTHQIVYFKE